MNGRKRTTHNTCVTRNTNNSINKQTYESGVKKPFINVKEKIFRSNGITLKSIRQVSKIPKSAVLINSEKGLTFYFSERCAYWKTENGILRLNHADFNRLLRQLCKFWENLNDNQKEPMERSYVV